MPGWWNGIHRGLLQDVFTRGHPTKSPSESYTGSSPVPGTNTVDLFTLIRDNDLTVKHQANIVITEAIQKRVNTKIDQCIATIEKKYNVKFKKPAVHYDVRGTTAGKAWYKKWVVGFNAVLLKENVDNFIARTVPHEIAHLATELIYPHAHIRVGRQKRSPHGAEWASIMTALGADASRCHSYDVENARVKRRITYAYKCAGCGADLNLGPKRHAALQRGTLIWHSPCGSARGRLTLVTDTKAPVVVKPVVPVVKPAKVAVPAGETKLAKCYRLFENYPGYTRAEMINVFVQEVDMTPAGAATYYAKLNKGR